MRILQTIMDTCKELGRHTKHTGIACDGYKIYVSEPNFKTIHTYNMSMEETGCIATCRGYKSICYDKKSNCFWGYSAQFFERVIKLNSDFEEIGYISINTRCEIKGEIVGISANCCDCSLLLAYSDSIIEVSKETGIATRVLSKNPSKRYTAVAGECEYYAFAYEKCLAQYLEIAEVEDTTIIRCCVEEGYWIKSMAINDECIYLLVEKCGTTCVMTLLISEVSCCPPPHPPCPPDPPHPPCPPDPPHPPRPPCPPPPCPPHPHPPCPPVMCWEDLCAVIHSIALGEAALSHILNAEGEKIQKGVKMSKNVDELLKLNDSVRRTIDKVAKLEYVLYSKLEAVKDMCPGIFSQSYKCGDCEHCGHCGHEDDCEHCDNNEPSYEELNCDHEHNHGFEFDFEDMFRNKSEQE